MLEFCSISLVVNGTEHEPSVPSRLQAHAPLSKPLYISCYILTVGIWTVLGTVRSAYLARPSTECGYYCYYYYYDCQYKHAPCLCPCLCRPHIDSCYCYPRMHRAGHWWPSLSGATQGEGGVVPSRTTTRERRCREPGEESTTSLPLLLRGHPGDSRPPPRPPQASLSPRPPLRSCVLWLCPA